MATIGKCKVCGEELEVQTEHDGDRTTTVTVKPCLKCLDSAYGAGCQQGYEPVEGDWENFIKSLFKNT
jgi:hypothetical protein